MQFFARFLLAVALSAVPVAASAAALTAAPSSGHTPLGVTFTTDSLAQSSYGISFGDGTSTALAPVSCTQSLPQSCTYRVSHTYTLAGTFKARLTNTNNTIASTTVVATSTSAPPTCSISASPASVSFGGSTTLRWSSVNATEGYITRIGGVGPAGSLNIIPPTGTTNYFGTFWGRYGTTTCQATVSAGATGGGTVTGGTATGETNISGSDATPGTAPQLGSTQPLQSTPFSGSFPSYAQQREATGLVQCTGANDCNICSAGLTLQAIINFLLGITMPLAAALFAWAGILYFTSGVKVENIGKAKNIFRTVGIGFVIALCGWLVVQVILNGLVGKNFFANIGGSWNSLDCSRNVRIINKSVTDWLNNSLPGLQSVGTIGGGVGGGTGGGSDSVPATAGTEGDATVRAEFAGADVCVNAPEPQTSLNGMQSDTVNQVLQIAQNVGGSCTADGSTGTVVTGGTETTGGHTCTGEGSFSHCNGYKADLRSTDDMNSYMYNLCNNNDQCTVGNVTYTRENKGATNDHWDLLVCPSGSVPSGGRCVSSGGR